MSDVPTATPHPAAGETASQPNEFAKSRMTILILVAAALVVGALLVYGIPHIRRFMQKREARELIAEASEHMTNEEWVSAIRVLGQANRLDPLNPEPMRLMARSLEEISGGMEYAAHIWRQLVLMQQATSKDIAACGLVLLRSGAREDARKMLDSIPAAEQSERPALELKAAFARMDDQPDLANKLIRSAYLADIQNPEAQLKLAMLDLGSPFLEVHEAATEKLWKIAESDSSQAVNAMRTLAEQTRFNVPQAEKMRQLLDKHPEASDERRLPVVSGVLRALPSEREKIIAAEAARHQGKSFEKTATFIKWLANNNEHQRLLSLLPPGQAIRDSDLFLSFVAAMENTHQWKELREVIRKNPSIPIPPSTMALILARCAHSLHEPADRVRGHLEDGIKMAWIVKDRPTVMTMGNTAEEFGHPDIAIEAYNLLASQPQFRLPVLERLLQLHQRQRDLPAMIDIINRCREEQPDNMGYLELWCYLMLLQGTDMEKASDIIDHHLKAHPDRLGSASFVQAFAAYRYGDLKLADRKVNLVATNKLPPGQRAVLAGILQACGREADAFRIAEKVPDIIVLAEEQRLLKTAF